MEAIRTLEPDELEDALAFERNYVGTQTTIEAFRERYRAWPELFVAAFEDGELVGEASGRVQDDGGSVELTAIGTLNGREREGIASRVLERFEWNASAYADRVTVASADNVEGFYRANGYEPVEILLQVTESALPSDYADRVPLRNERSPSSDERFLYADFETYATAYRDELKTRVNAHEVNAIFEKPTPNHSSANS